MTLAVNIAQSGSNNVTFRNRIINGAMVIDQRNAGASVTANDSVFPVDRFSIRTSLSSKGTAQQSTTVPAGFKNSLLFTSTAATSLGASDYMTITQFIEGFNVADLGWGTANAQTVTLSFWVRSSLTGTFGGSINNTSSRSYPFTYTISSANTFEYKTITIAGDTSGTWPTDNTSCIRLWLGLGVGSTFSGTAGAWAGAAYLSATGATSVVGTNGATFYITGVQLEAGTTASPFEYRQYGTELALCQRYFISIGSGAIGANNSAGQLMASYAMPVDMRVVPAVTQSGTITVYGPSFADYNTSTPVSQSGSSVRQSIIAFTGASGGGAGIASRTYGTGVVLFNSEL